MKNPGGRETFQDSNHVAAPGQSLQGHSDKGNSTLSFLPRNRVCYEQRKCQESANVCLTDVFLKIELGHWKQTSGCGENRQPSRLILGSSEGLRETREKLKLDTH